MGASWELLVPSWALGWPSCCQSWVSSGPRKVLEGILEHLRRYWGRFWRALGGVLEGSWGVLGRSSENLVGAFGDLKWFLMGLEESCSDLGVDFKRKVEILKNHQFSIDFHRFFKVWKGLGASC